LSAAQLEAGYHWAYREFYRWRSIARGAASHDTLASGLRHAAYAAGWKKFEPMWDVIIRARRTAAMLPVLETILSEFGRRAPAMPQAGPPATAAAVEPLQAGPQAYEPPRMQIEARNATAAAPDPEQIEARNATAAAPDPEEVERWRNVSLGYRNRRHSPLVPAGDARNER
jgi:hypothetical protein